MADNFSDKVIKKLQKQNLAVDLTEENKPVAQEEVVAQSQDFQTYTANAGTPGASANGKDIVVIPGGGTTADSTSQINFYWSKPATQGSNNVDTNLRTTIFNFVENANPNEEPVLAIGGYNGTYYSPTATYGGVTGQTVAKVWIHPFSGTVDIAKLVLEQTANTASITFGTSTGVSQTTTTRGHLGWTGTRLVIGDGSTANTIAYTSDIAGAQNVYSSISDGTNSASAGNTTDTIKFRGSNGVTTTVGSNDPTWGDNLSISLSSVPNSALANSSVTIGSTTISLGSTATSISGLTSISATTFTGALSGNASTATALATARTIQGVSFNGSADITVVTNGTGVTVSGTQVSIGQPVATNSNVTFGSVAANNVRVGNTANQIDTSTGNLVLDSTGGQVTINDNVVINGTTVTLAGSSATISANSNRIQNVTDPTAAQDAATKAYVDAVRLGMDVHASVRVISTSQLAGNYVQTQSASSTPGSTAVGATITSTTNTAFPAIDGVTITNTGTRILVQGGISGTFTIASVVTTPGANAANGIYTLTQVGSGAAPWILTRATDTDDNLEFQGGTFVFVQEGTLYLDSGWICTNNTAVTSLSIGSDLINFTQFTSASEAIAGAGLTKTGNTLDVGGTTDRISVSASAVDIASTYAGQTSIVTLGTVTTGTWSAGTIAVNKGGTGQTSLQSNGVLFGNGTSGILTTAQGTSGQILVVNGSNVPALVSMSADAAISAGGALTINNTAVTFAKIQNSAAGGLSVVGRSSSGAASFAEIAATADGSVLRLNGTTLGFGTINLASNNAVAGTLPIGNGGTGIASAVTGLLYGNGTSYAAASATNINSSYGSQTANYVLAAPNGTPGNPGFRALVAADLPTATTGALGVASFNSSFFTVSSGAVSLATVPVGSGGTGQTSWTGNGVLYASGTTTLTNGSAFTWIPSANATGSSSALYVSAASTVTGTAVHITAGALGAGNVLVVNGSGTTGKLISGQTGGTEKFSVDVNGNLRATTKSFDIPHPTKEGKRLVYGVLEGPEHGVYHRGTVEGKDKIKVELPEYWHKLVGEDYSVQLTSWGAYAVHLVEKTENYFIIQLSSNFVMRKLKTIKVDYVVHGARLDAPLEIEQ